MRVKFFKIYKSPLDYLVAATLIDMALVALNFLQNRDEKIPASIFVPFLGIIIKLYIFLEWEF